VKLVEGHAVDGPEITPAFGVPEQATAGTKVTQPMNPRLAMVAALGAAVPP
jgi:hypothetical protein